MSLRDDDDREWRRMQREEDRANSRGNVAPRPDPTAPGPARVVPAPPARSQPPRPALSSSVAAGTHSPAFRIVDELPANDTGRRVPQQRAELMKFAKANPGKWIEYRSTPADPYKTGSHFAGNVRSGKCGFTPKGAFEACTRRKVAYIRYVGTEGGDQQ